MIFELVDGRNLLYQWDLNRKITVNDESIKEVHFCNKTGECSLVVEVVDGLANIPNILLQSNFDIRVYGYDGEATLHEEIFKVKARTRPADYVYTETQVLTVEQLAEELRTEIDERITAVEEGLITDGFATTEYVEEAINALNIPEANQVYIDVNFNNQAAMRAEIEDALALNQIPVLRLNNIPYLYAGKWGNICVFTRTNINPYNNKDINISQIKYNLETQKLEGSTPNSVPIQFKLYPNYNSEATETLTKIIIDGVNYAIPQGEPVDLTGYATEEYVNEAVSNVSVDLSGYAKESYVDSAIAQSVSGLATEEYVDEALANIDIPSGGFEYVYEHNTKADIDAILAAGKLPIYRYNSATEKHIAPLTNTTSEYYEFSALEGTYSFSTRLNLATGTWSGGRNTRINLDDNADLSNYYTKEEVDELIPEGGSTDLSNYYTKEETYSKTEVDEAIANAGGSGDLTNYYTKEETEQAIQDALSAIGVAEGGAY